MLKIKFETWAKPLACRFAWSKLDGGTNPNDERVLQRRAAACAGNSGTRVDHVLCVGLQRQPGRHMTKIGGFQHGLVTSVGRAGTGEKDHVVPEPPLSRTDSQICHSKTENVILPPVKRSLPVHAAFDEQIAEIVTLRRPH